MTSQSILRKLETIRSKNECDSGEEGIDLSYVHGTLKKGKFEPYRHYTASVLLYPTNDKHYEIIKEVILNKRYNYAIIIHDHDLKENKTQAPNKDDEELDFDDLESLVDDDDNKSNLKKVHAHLIISYSNSRTNTAVAKELKLASRYVRMYSKLSSSLLYLIHRDYQEKYQYSVEDVCGTLTPKLGCLDAFYDRDESDVLKELLWEIKSFPRDYIIDVTDFAINILDKGYSPHVQQKYFYLLNNCINQHNRFAEYLLKRKENNNG